MPPTRMLCSAKGCGSSRQSNLVSIILNKAADAMMSDTECQSTEEMKKEILEVNRKIAENIMLDPEYKEKIKKAEIVSLDVKALYPSMKIEEVKKIIIEKLVKVQEDEKLKINDVDYHEIGKYLSIVCTEEEIKEHELEDAIPKKTANNRGPKPGPAYWESDYREVYEDGKKKKIAKWIESRNIREKDEQKMIALMLAKAIEVVMKNHTYRFDGKYYKQRDGGPIGDQLSQAVARIVMIWFDERYLRKCRENEIEMILYKRYVDDINMIVIPPELIEEEEDDQNENIDIAEKVGLLCKKLADQENEMLIFEEDLGKRYTDGKLPILDLKVWIEKTEEEVKIKHEFYKKPMASRYTLREGTAYPKSKLRAVMIEEVMRRLRNCSPEMSWEKKGIFLSELAEEMMNSGHNETFRKEIMERAITKYKKELIEHNSGRKDIYRNREEEARIPKTHGSAKRILKQQVF